MTEHICNTHKHTRISQNWGTEYSYFDRSKQLERAKALTAGHRSCKRKGGKYV